ncbi:MAG: hypothetical protein OXF27_17155 [Acidobacteria bacterium]|nr:hypothetical protein [Acidobacteriota bacterium]
MSTARAIRAGIRKLSKGKPFTSERFLTHGSRSTVDRTLSRLACRGEIQRLVHGAEAARRFKLSTQVPTAPVFLTSASSRTIRIANYDQCLDGRFRLVPDDDQLPGLQTDYDAMRAAAIVPDDVPGFERWLKRSVSSKPTRTAPAECGRSLAWPWSERAGRSGLSGGSGFVGGLSPQETGQ